MPELLADVNHCHLRPSNLFTYKNVCKQCFLAYSKIDYERTKFFTRKELNPKAYRDKVEDSEEELDSDEINDTYDSLASI